MRWFVYENGAGHKHEILMLPLLQKFFNDPTIKQCPRNHTFDYIGENKFIELKQRKCEKDKYLDTMIGLNKIEYCHGKDADCYFVFSFTDGVYYWKYNNVDQLNYRCDGRRDHNCNEFKDYCYIPVNLLKKI
jgi:hypothetical protein